jgi:hypothetical protein
LYVVARDAERASIQSDFTQFKEQSQQQLSMLAVELEQKRQQLAEVMLQLEQRQLALQQNHEKIAALLAGNDEKQQQISSLGAAVDEAQLSLQQKDESISELSASIKEQQQRILELTDEKQQQLAEQAAVLALLQQREPREPGKCLFLSQKHFAHFIFQLTPLGVTKLWHAHPN